MRSLGMRADLVVRRPALDPVGDALHFGVRENTVPRLFGHLPAAVAVVHVFLFADDSDEDRLGGIRGERWIARLDEHALDHAFPAAVFIRRADVVAGLRAGAGGG